MKTLFLLANLLWCSLASTAAEAQEQLVATVASAKSHVLPLLQVEMQDRLYYEVNSPDPTIASHALLATWLLGDSGQIVELVWWRSKSPQLRSLAAALLLTGRQENTSNVPLLEPERFNAKEKQERAKELELVVKSSAAIGSALKNLISSTYSENPSEWKSALQLRFSTFQ